MLDDALRKVSNALFWCFGMAMLLLLVWFGMFALLHQPFYELHSEFYEITVNQFDMMHYMLMALLKVEAFLFFLFPAVGIRVVLYLRGAQPGQ